MSDSENDKSVEGTPPSQGSKPGGASHSIDDGAKNNNIFNLQGMFDSLPKPPKPPNPLAKFLPKNQCHFILIRDGRRCGKKSVDGSQFCSKHGDDTNVKAETAEATEETKRKRREKRVNQKTADILLDNALSQQKLDKNNAKLENSISELKEILAKSKKSKK